MQEDKALGDERRRAARALILATDWREEPLLAGKAEDWVRANQRWVEQVRWGQWEGLRRCGENARTWAEYREAVDDWVSEDRRYVKPGGARGPRRAWALEPLRSGTPGLRESLMGTIEEASRPPESAAASLGRLLKERGFTDAEKSEIDQLQRARRARKFVELLVLCVKLTQKEAEECWASIF